MLSETPSKNLARTGLIAGLTFGLLAACAAPPPSATINDPAEGLNRRVHAFNVGADRAVVRPASKVYGAVLPDQVERGVQNFANNLDLPGDVANNLLQARPGNALHNTVRFAMNTLLGIGGVFDVATGMGIPEKKTDFGETLHVWGVGEGAFVMLPVLGPSTGRDAVGEVVDIVANPIGALVTPRVAAVGTVASIGSRLGDRSRFSSTVDQLLYGGADSYAQLRLLYLQNRRFELGQTNTTADDESALDPYEDPYGQ